MEVYVCRTLLFHKPCPLNDEIGAYAYVECLHPPLMNRYTYDMPIAAYFCWVPLPSCKPTRVKIHTL